MLMAKPSLRAGRLTDLLQSAMDGQVRCAGPQSVQPSMHA